MTTDPAVQAAIEAARIMQRRWHSDDTEAVCRVAVEAARPIIEAEVWAAARTAYRASRATVRTEPENG